MINPDSIIDLFSIYKIPLSVALETSKKLLKLQLQAQIENKKRRRDRLPKKSPAPPQLPPRPSPLPIITPPKPDPEPYIVYEPELSTPYIVQMTRLSSGKPYKIVVPTLYTEREWSIARGKLVRKYISINEI